MGNRLGAVTWGVVGALVVWVGMQAGGVRAAEDAAPAPAGVLCMNGRDLAVLSRELNNRLTHPRGVVLDSSMHAEPGDKGVTTLPQPVTVSAPFVHRDPSGQLSLCVSVARR